MTDFKTYQAWDKSPQDLLDALRSGQYKQLMGTLCEMAFNEEDEEVPTGAYCCLGVYEDITSDQWNTVTRYAGSFEEYIPDNVDLGGENWVDGEELHWLRTRIRTWCVSQDLETDLENLLIRANDAGVTNPPFQRPIKVIEQFIEGKRAWDKSDIQALGIPIQ